MEEPEPIRTNPPGWVNLDRFIHHSSRAADAGGGHDDTTSESEPFLTCTNRSIRASLRLAGAGDSPVVSRLHLHWPGRPKLRWLLEPRVIAAHGLAILSAIVPFEEPNKGSFG
ncbi:unnamed protein product [Urochloa humidicola]